MNYFLTGGTGFIGRFLVKKLLARGGNVHLLVREESLDKLEALREQWGDGAERVHAVTGDLNKPGLGLDAKAHKALAGKVDHFFHLAAVYDMASDEATQQQANVDGTRHALEAADALKAGCFHHVSSIAAAGLYKDTFREDMFDEATNLEHPYLKSKHDSEGVVRDECQVPFRIYRPGMVVGHSRSGEMDKVDGCRNGCPPWVLRADG